MPVPDLCVCAHVVHGAGLNAVMESGLTPEHFVSDGLKVHEYILDYVTKYGKVPSTQTILADINIVIPPMTDVPEPLSYYIDKLKRRTRDALVKEKLKKQTAAFEKVDPDGAIVAAQELIAEVSRQNLMGEPVEDWVTGTQKRWDDYKIASAIPNGLLGIPTPWDLLNDKTQGMQKGDFWVLVARPGGGKTWALCRMSLHAWQYDFRPLVVSMEMPVAKIKRRIDAIYSRLPYTALKKGNLGIHIENNYKTALDSLKGKAPLNIISRRRAKSPRDIAVLIQQLGPKVVFIDGLYKLRPAVSSNKQPQWERVAQVADEIQEIAEEFGIPILGTTQFNKSLPQKKQESAGLENMAFADTIGMNADVVIALLTSKTLKASGEVLHKLIKNREDDVVSYTTKFDLDQMDFAQVGVWEGEGGDDDADASVDF